MQRILLTLSLLIILGSALGAGAARAVEDPANDYCSTRMDVCLTQCSQYNFRIGSINYVSPRTVACGLECSVAYAGCLMLRFREGV